MYAFDQLIDLPTDKTIDVLTVGELLIDMISAEYDDSFESTTYNKFFGGSPSNIAMNVQRLGIRSKVASAVGQDGMGRFLTGKLEQAGIDTGCLQTVDEPTSMVVVTKSRATPVPIFYRGADYQLAYTPELEQAVRQAKIVHFSCWPISRQPSRGTLERVIEEARRYGTLVAFDPNYHPMVWQKSEDGPAYIRTIIAKADIVKPSEDDAERLFGPDTPENQIAKFHQLGAKLVIMTLGRDGAIASNGSELHRFPTLATEVVDTTGAGDAFWSGFYAAAVKGYPMREALTLGFAVSAFKLRYTGAIAPLPTLEAIRDQFGL